MYQISVELNEAEFMEIAGMVWASDIWEGEQTETDIFRAFQKIKKQCVLICSDEQADYLAKTVIALQKVFGTPSIERGMVQGGMQGIIESLSNEMDKLIE